MACRTAGMLGRGHGPRFWSRRRFWLKLLETVAASGAITRSTAVDSAYVRAQRSAFAEKGGGERAGHWPLARRTDYEIKNWPKSSLKNTLATLAAAALTNSRKRMNHHDAQPFDVDEPRRDE